ncbi:MBL fold metallo-hydrolase [Aestuariibaculum sp. M13]|uniref:MBL fold metallo-hydrolase n=1 Tax=Aestuariibaculum sp. M13 TaxID=2967132 RepID=UPI002159EE78|nr:MBL fold metallo-hydrolase [Aestuariibaculum sp. M13]MCR8667424.1 MBL fold metallo-hydrolase [Aestuariibaculum sp. M13]
MALEVIKSKIGDVEIIQVVEQPLDQYYSMFLPMATPEEIEKIDWLKTSHHVNKDLSLKGSSQMFVVKVNKRVFVIDTCIGNEKQLLEFPFWANQKFEFLETLDEIGFDKNSVTDVLCTHLHLDHVGWNTYYKDGIWHPTFPKAKYHFAKDEYDWWHEVAPVDDFLITHKDVLMQSVYPVIRAGLANFVARDADLGDGISLISTPGHTVAHISVQVKNGDQTFIIGGDMCHHPCQIAKPDWAMAADFSQDQSTESRQKMFENIADTETLYTCTHFKSPSFGKVKKNENGEYVYNSIDYSK